jgi:formyltetrahydrofolate deformylase
MPTQQQIQSATLLLHCPDQKGIVAAVAQLLFEHGGNIMHADQHQDMELGLFFMRIEWSLGEFSLDDAQFRHAFRPLAERFGMRWQVTRSTAWPRIAIFVSKQQHCLVDLLYRHQIGELACHIPLIISNHTDAEATAAHYGVEFLHIPVTSSNKAQAEAEEIAALEQHGVELIVLARYMQVLSPNFCARYSNRIINVHHSLLPAFSGGAPHKQAFDRGVRLIGATAHYVTEVLDDGPIIEQEVIRVSHRDQLEDLKEKGRDAERLVLSRAVRWHVERRIVSYGRKTVVFD